MTLSNVQHGQTSSLQTEQAVLMQNRRAQTTDTIHGVIPLDEKKGSFLTKYNMVRASSEKPMAPKKYPANEVRDIRRDVQNVMTQRLAAMKIKQERASLDESSGKTKVREAPQFTPSLFLLCGREREIF